MSFFTKRSKLLITAVVASAAVAVPSTAGATKPVLPAASADQAPDKAGAPASPKAEKALAALQKRIEKAAAKDKGKSFTSYVDHATGQIVIMTDAADPTVSEITTDPDPANKQELAKAKIVRGVTNSDSWHRRDDVPSFWGGAGLRVGSGLCSSGYAARNAAGAVFSVTAGHCYANGATVLSESGLSTYGTVSNRRLPTVTGHAMDVELVGGSSYAGRIYTGGVTSTTSLPVAGAGSAVAGFNNYCHSGRTTGQHCGHTAVSVSGQFCSQTGCKSPVIVYNGGNMPAGGDSGGSFYALGSSGTTAHIRGNHIGSGGGNAYAMPWTVISQQLGLSIVTG